MSRRYKTIDFDTEIFQELIRGAINRGADPRGEKWSFVIGIEGACAFYREAEARVARGEGVRQPQSKESILSDVVCRLNGIPVRVRAALDPPGRVGLLPPYDLEEFDQTHRPPRRPRRYRWT